MSAHPDDMELESGGTLAKFARKGYDVYHLILTTGYKDSVSISIEQRKNEAKDAANILGIKEVRFFNCQDTELTGNGQIISQVDALVDKIKPDILISHHPFDSHQDHKAAAEIMFATSRQGRVKNVLSGSPLPYRPNVFAFRPQFFVDITETIEHKLNAIRVYKSQYDKFGGEKLIERISAMAKYYGWATGYEYAESFEIIRMDDSLWI
jgi:LmbE family N-acetylglucosaminyl deacetylase